MVLGGLVAGNEVKGQDVYTANPFVQPNDSTLNWYGSGDANGDNAINYADVERMDDVINGTYTPNTSQDPRVYDRMDVNGDETIDNQDRTMLNNHLTTNPFFQPNWYWNKLKTRAEREDWLVKMLAIDKTNEIIQSGDVKKNCRFYSNQTMINFHGFSDPIDIANFNQVYPFEWKDNNRFNLPLLDVRILDFNQQGTTGHEMNTTITGDNSRIWGDQDPIEPQTDHFSIQPGEEYLIGDNARFYIRGPPTTGFQGLPEEYEIKMNNLVAYNLLNKIPSLFWPQPGDDFGQILQRDKTDPIISTSLQEGATYQPGANATINVTDDKGLKKSWYGADDGLTKIALSEGVNNITLPSSEGNFEYIIYAGDYFYNEVLERRNITIEEQGDVTPPEISWNSSASGTHANNIEFNWNITDPNFQDAWISKDDEKQNISQTGSMEFNDLPNGTYKFGIGARDSFGNADSTFEEHTITGVGLEKKLFGDDFNLYPNPSTNGIFNVRYKSENNEVIYEEIFDSSGKLISQESFEGGNERIINLTDAAPGLYLYRLRKSNGETRTEKIIKQ